MTGFKVKKLIEAKALAKFWLVRHQLFCQVDPSDDGRWLVTPSNGNLMFESICEAFVAGFNSPSIM